MVFYLPKRGKRGFPPYECFCLLLYYVVIHSMAIKHGDDDDDDDNDDVDDDVDDDELQKCYSLELLVILMII